MHGDCVWALMGVSIVQRPGVACCAWCCTCSSCGHQTCTRGAQAAPKRPKKSIHGRWKDDQGKSPCRGRLCKRDDTAKQAAVPPDPDRIGFAAKTRDAAMKSRPGGDDARCDGEREVGQKVVNRRRRCESVHHARRGVGAAAFNPFQRGSDPESAAMRR